MTEQAIPYGYCHCGCGHKTTIANQTWEPFGHVKGEPKRYIVGHNARKFESGPEWEPEDRGYPQGPCWIWKRARNVVSGYGTMRVNGRMEYAHIVYFERVNGPVPDGLQVDHLCNQRDCVNPSHLEAVTNAVNSQRGKMAKLTEDAVREIRRDFPTCSIRALAERYGVSLDTVYSVVNRKTWGNVT